VLLSVSVVGLLYPTVLYPLVLGLLSRSRWGRGAHSSGRESDRVDGFAVVIPAHNEERVIARKLRTTLAAVGNAGCPGQVIVAADGCTDRTCELTRRFSPAVELAVVQDRGGIVGAFKAGLALARYDIVVFSDADIEVDPGNYAELISHFADPSVGGACGATRMRVREGSGLNLEHLNVFLRTWVRQRQSEHRATVGADGANWAVRKRLIRWPSSPQLAEDLVVPLEVVRQGYRFVFEPRAGALETSPGAVGDEFHRKVRTVAGGIQAGWYCRWMFRAPYRWVGFHYVSWKICKYLVSLWVLLGVIAVLNLASYSPIFLAASSLILGAVLLGLAAGAARRLIPGAVPRVPESIWYALVTLVTPVAAVTSLVTKRATTLWRMAAR
jgi:cellulose synthase/poly-beta-1,6-N-acetylglucosamine synthase-like glycosyltransferase